jgi:hypothetical protein
MYSEFSRLSKRRIEPVCRSRKDSSDHLTEYEVVIYDHDFWAFIALASLFHLEDGGRTFFRNVLELLPGYMASYLRRQHFSQPPLGGPQIQEDADQS